MKREITDKEFADLYPQALQPKLQSRQAKPILRRQFCRRLVLANKCTEECNNCQPFISEIFQRMSSSTDVQNFEAVLTWHCKNAAAKVQEQKQVETHKPPVDAFDRPIEINAFTYFAQAIT